MPPGIASTVSFVTFVSGGFVPPALRGTTSDLIVHIPDWYPTLCGLAGADPYGLLELANCDGEDLVKLRNPNGHAGWKGDWSRASSKWTYERKQRLGLDKEDSGVFWMSWADFTTWFAEVAVCRVKEALRRSLRRRADAKSVF